MTARIGKSKSPGRVPLERALSKLGFASRTEARSLIESGRVKVHGSIEKNPLRPVNPDTAHIEVDRIKTVKESSRILLFHKPKSVLTSKRDPEGRPVIYDLLPPEFHHFHPVGRLDLHTTGLLLLTNDTKLSSFLTDPENEVPRTYLALVKGLVTEEDSARMVAGIEDQGEHLSARTVVIRKASGKESLLELELTEGKNREIRRLLKALGHEVKTLKRIAFGPYTLSDLKAGEWREDSRAPFKSRS